MPNLQPRTGHTADRAIGLVDVDYLDLWYRVSSSLGKFGEPRSYSVDTIMGESMRYVSVQYPLLPPCVHRTAHRPAATVVGKKEEVN